MPTIRLRNGTTAGVTPIPHTNYFSFDGHQNAFIQDNTELHRVVDDIIIKSDEYDQQITDYLAGNLTLVRGLPRQHPLFFEVTEMGILAPLGVGDMPDWATNTTRFIPFGPDVNAAQGVALGRAGMGPGDNQQMMAGFATLRNTVAQVDVGATVSVTVAVNAGIAFYNSGEIQVRGPLSTGLTIQPVQLPNTSLAAVPDNAAVAIYKAEHGGLRHQATVAALAQHGNGNLTAIRNDAIARAQHAETLLAMRRALLLKAEATVDLIIGKSQAANRPGNRDDVNYRHYLDSSLNREAHDVYVAEVAAGRTREEASTAAQRRAMLWLTRIFVAYDQDEPPFPNNWETL